MADAVRWLNRLPMTKELRRRVETINADMPVGLGTVPRFDQGGNVWTPHEPPFYILTPLWSEALEGSWGRPDEDVMWRYQITAVSKTLTQIEWMRDAALRLFLGRDAAGAYATDLAVPGMAVIFRSLDDDDGVPGPTGDVLQADVRIALTVTPADA